VVCQQSGRRIQRTFLKQHHLLQRAHRSSKNYSHEGTKLELLEKRDRIPEAIILGSSWAEYGIDTGRFCESLGLEALNLAIISSQVYEQSLVYKYVCDKFQSCPKFTILLLDYSHIPVQYQTSVTKFLYKPSDITNDTGIFS